MADSSAEWFRCDIDRSTLKRLSRRTNLHGLLYLVFFLLCVSLTGWLAMVSIGTWWCILTFPLYGSIWIFATSIVHETCHGTTFRNKFLNESVLFIFGLLVQQSPCVLRYTHAKHHSETAINGVDPEIVLSNPLTWSGLIFKQILDLNSIWYYFKTIVLMSFKRSDKHIRNCLPHTAMGRAVAESRVYLLVYLSIIAWAILNQSWLPIVMLLLPRVFGGPMHGVILSTQHIGLVQDKKDHRLTTRTMVVNPFLRLLYWNMNYHIEHHMFSGIPFHALPELHRMIRGQCPTPTKGVFGALGEIIETIRTQQFEPGYTRSNQY